MSSSAWPSPILLPYRGVGPRVDPSAFLAPGVVVVGDVVIGPQTSVWFGSVLRADMGTIRVGARSNLQEGTVVHVTSGGQGVFIGDDVTIGHQALVHECRLEDRAFVGMRAAVLDGAVIESGGVLAAGALLTPNKRLPSGQVWTGIPARYWRDVTPDDWATFTSPAAEYVELVRHYGGKLNESLRAVP